MILPILVLDSRERWRPVGVEESLRAAGIEPETALVDPVQIDFPDRHAPPDLPLVGYRRVVKAGPLWWHQLWLWWPDNPKEYAFHGRHEGDWELVQIGTADRTGTDPVLVTLSRHGTAAKKEHWACELEHGRPVVYVARDSHAHYFTPVSTVEDRADGKGDRITDLEVRPFGPWASYGGRWGHSETSPVSPGRHTSWHAPATWHARAR